MHGPAGCGKKALLRVLSGQVRWGLERCSDISINDQPLTPQRFRALGAFVPQETLLRADETPREAVSFAAAVRLPPSVSGKERRGVVEGLLRRLGLQGCADTLVGAAPNLCISRGEAMLTALAAELVTRPALLLLEEPTAGLDAPSIATITGILRDLADQGCTVACSSGQLPRQLYDRADGVMLMLGGRVFYQGARTDLRRWFADFGHTCREGSPAPACFLDLLMSLETHQLRSLHEATSRSAQQGALSLREVKLRRRQVCQLSVGLAARLVLPDACSMLLQCRSPEGSSTLRAFARPLLTRPSTRFGTPRGKPQPWHRPALC